MIGKKSSFHSLRFRCTLFDDERLPGGGLLAGAGELTHHSGQVFYG